MLSTPTEMHSAHALLVRLIHVCIAVTTVRLGFYAQQMPAISLASAKSNALAAWAVIWLGYLTFRAAGKGQPVFESWQTFMQPELWLLILWSALGPGALAAFLQSKARPIHIVPFLLVAECSHERLCLDSAKLDLPATTS